MENKETTQKKTCTNCWKEFDIEDFPLQGKKNKTRRAYCKKCYAKYVYQFRLEKEIEANPENYVDCDICDNTYHNKFKACPRCKKGINHERIIKSALFTEYHYRR